MTNEEHARMKAQIIKGEENLRSHYDLEDKSTLKGLLYTCIEMIQQDDKLITCLEQMKDSLEKENKELQLEKDNAKVIERILKEVIKEKETELLDLGIKNKWMSHQLEGTSNG
jgi:hypothetical protein